MKHERSLHPRTVSRLGGALLLIVIALGAFGQTLVQPRVAVLADPTSTAANVGVIDPVSWLATAATLALLLSGIALALVLNLLLQPVSKNVARLAVVLLLAGLTAECMATLDAIGALSLLSDHTSVVRESRSMTNVAGTTLGVNIALAFLGSAYLVLAYLIVRSGYLPRTLGALIFVGGVGYLMKSSTAFLAPDLSQRIYPAIMAPGFFGELSLALWLLGNGVDMQVWTQARAHMRPRS